jgi:hypothetical protein
MRTRLVAVNGLILAGIAWIALSSSEIRPKNLLPHGAKAESATPAEMAAIESRASLEPTADNVSALAAAYLDRGQPGLASAVIERAPRLIREDARIADLHARALFHRGRTREALAAVQDVLATCKADASRCRPWQVAKASGQAAFLEELVRAGVEDPMDNPQAVRAAYERSAHRGGLVAMR